MFRILTLILITTLAILAPPVFANEVGFIYSQASTDSNWGINADYEKQVSERVKIGIEGQLQSGDVHIGNADFALTLNLPVDIRLESNNMLKGYSLDGMGSSTDLGASLVFPLGDTEWSAGVFGKNGNPFAPAYELKDPTDPASAELIDAGIDIIEKSSLNLAVRGEFDKTVLDRTVEVGARALFELRGEGEKVHQLVVDLETGGTLLGVNWTVQGTVVAQAHGDTIQHDRSIMTGIKIPF